MRLSYRQDISARRVPELKTLCREKGLPVSGKRADLIDRLCIHYEATRNDIDVYIKAITGHITTIAIMPSATGRELQEIYGRESGIDPEKVILQPNVAGCGQLDMDKTLMEQGILMGTTIFVHIRLGCKN